MCDLVLNKLCPFLTFKDVEEPRALTDDILGTGHRGESTLMWCFHSWDLVYSWRHNERTPSSVQVSQFQDVELLVTAEETEELQENFSEIAVLPRDSQRQILAAQFECYLRMITDPPRAEEGEM